jgi:hypothetical protein
MLYPGDISSFNWSFDNYGTNPSLTPGTSTIPGASNAEGGNALIATGAQLTQDVYWVHVAISGGGTSAAAKNHLLDVGVDPAGGSSYTYVVSNMVCGATPAYGAAPGAVAHFYFPLFIKAGSQVAMRVQGSNATAGTVRITAKFYGQPSSPHTMPVASFSETIGTITNSNGVSFTPGNAADGTAVSLGTTAKAMWWWQLCYQIDNGTITAEQTYIDLGYGPTGSQKWFKRLIHAGTTTEAISDQMLCNLLFAECYMPLPAGTELWVRGRCVNAPDTGYNAVAVGFGG